MALRITFDEYGPITVGTIESVDMLDENNVREFGRQVLAHAAARPGIRLLLNFQHVAFLSSAAITELLRVLDACRPGGGQLRLCGLTDSIRSVFEITNLAKLFFVYPDDTLDTALARFSRALTVRGDADGWADPAGGGAG
jgi:anti-sigma B factor antagonist